jgi:hypothetical protein
MTVTNRPTGQKKDFTKKKFGEFKKKIECSETTRHRRQGDGGSASQKRRVAPLADTVRDRKNSSTPVSSDTTRPLRRVQLTKSKATTNRKRKRWCEDSRFRSRLSLQSSLARIRQERRHLGAHHVSTGICYHGKNRSRNNMRKILRNWLLTVRVSRKKKQQTISLTLWSILWCPWQALPQQCGLSTCFRWWLGNPASASDTPNTRNRVTLVFDMQSAQCQNADLSSDIRTRPIWSNTIQEVGLITKNSLVD